MNDSPRPQQQGHESGDVREHGCPATSPGPGQAATFSLVILTLFAVVCTAVVLLVRSPSNGGPDAVYGVVGIAGSRETVRANVVSLLSKRELRLLKARGIEDPLAAIAEDLGPGRGIVLRTGEPGEPAGFYFGPDIRVLNEKWVVAGINDGRRRRGEVMLEYRVRNNRTITWSVVSTRLDEPDHE